MAPKRERSSARTNDQTCDGKSNTENTDDTNKILQLLHSLTNKIEERFDSLTNKNEERFDSPSWSLAQVYAHFNDHVADNWLARQEALRQTNVMLQRTANTCLTKDGPPNPNTVKTFIELQKLQTILRKPEPMGLSQKDREG